jgi:hemerythrin-like metal-binding protein
MSTRAWNQRYATGIASIDAQHVTLFESAQGLNDALRSGHAREAVPGLLEHLIVYSLSHFADEEAHMERLCYPGLPGHRDVHRDLMAQVYDLQDRYLKGEPQVVMELTMLVTRWLKKHIQEHDQAFAAFIRREENKTEPDSPASSASDSSPEL